MSDVEVPFLALRDQVNNAIHLIVQLTRHSDGTRRIIEVAPWSRAGARNTGCSTG